MDFFDFHHHKRNTAFGIYNLDMNDIPPGVPFSVGIHPKAIDLSIIEKQFQWLEASITEKCIAIGECGLDSFAETDQKVQEDVLIKKNASRKTC